MVGFRRILLGVVVVVLVGSWEVGSWRDLRMMVDEGWKRMR